MGQPQASLLFMVSRSEGVCVSSKWLEVAGELQPPPPLSLWLLVWCMLVVCGWSSVDGLPGLVIYVHTRELICWGFQ